MKRPAATSILGIAIGILGLLVSISPLGLLLEESVGLHGLFHLRGSRPAPAEAVIVTMDMASINHFNLDPKTKLWPRELHARMIHRLSDLGVNTIAMDIFFEKPKSPQEDQLLAGAIQQAGNVLLSSSIQINKASLQTGQSGDNNPALLNIEKIIPPLPLFANAAVAQAPFPLPKVPVKISQFWTFKASAGDLPTFPTVALQLFWSSYYDDFIRLLESAGIKIPANLPRTRSALFSNDGLLTAIRGLKSASLQTPQLFNKAALRLKNASQVDPSQMKALNSLLALYNGADSRHLNYYGYPGAIRTISYHKLFDDSSPQAALDLKGKIVFIGLSRRLRLDQDDGYHTVFSQDDGTDISGVEIAATAFSNLLDDSWLKPLPKEAEMAVMIAWGLVIACGAYYLPLSLSLPVIITLAGAYGLFTFNRFTAANIWWPLAVPLLIQIPVGYLSTLMLKQHDVQHERRNIRKAFGYYLPDTVVNRLAKDISNITADSRTVHGTCLFTDAAQYTHLSEVLSPDQLGRYMNRYYEILFAPIRSHGGIISDVVGDAVLALWPTTEEHHPMRLAACTAALEIDTALHQSKFIEDHPVLATRIGIHAGRMQLGSVGAIDHFEYRAVGEVVNTASRIEGLNKHLNTRILASEEAISDLSDFETRPMGTFVLAGKAKPIAIFELFAIKDNSSPQMSDLCTLFQEGLEQFRRRAWPQAETLFTRALQIHEEDGPSAFYINQCRRFLNEPPSDNWQGHIVMDSK